MLAILIFLDIFFSILMAVISQLVKISLQARLFALHFFAFDFTQTTFNELMTFSLKVKPDIPAKNPESIFTSCMIGSKVTREPAEPSTVKY